MPIGINGSGTITGISAGGLPDATITQAELASGVAGTGPAFSATNSSSISVSNNTFTKLSCGTEVFDTNNNYDTATFRFTPNVPGYYYFYGFCFGTGSTNTSLVEALVYKNGSVAIGGSVIFNAGTPYNSAQSNTCVCLYMNGTTDYVELYGRVVGGGTLTISSPSGGFTNTQFGGFLVRAA